jgi:hypothetical protein
MCTCGCVVRMTSSVLDRLRQFKERLGSQYLQTRRLVLYSESPTPDHADAPVVVKAESELPIELASIGSSVPCLPIPQLPPPQTMADSAASDKRTRREQRLHCTLRLSREPTWCYLLDHDQDVKTHSYIGCCRNPIRRLHQMNRTLPCSCKTTRPASPHWRLRVIVGPFTPQGEWSGRAFRAAWRSGSRGSASRILRGVILGTSMGLEVACRDPLEVEEKLRERADAMETHDLDKIRRANWATQNYMLRTQRGKKSRPSKL